MKKRYHLIIVLAFLIGMNLNAQVKIGNNPNTIDPNSLVELESTNKGFLAPRVALNSSTSVLPLTAPVPVGMLVYSTGGALTDGFYYWNGSQWLLLLTSVNRRNNYVLVKSQSDFPAPVAGVITLAANTIYDINGSINLSSKINLNGSTLTGLDGDVDQLIYTAGAGELFTGSSGGEVENLTLVASNVGTKLFNLDAGGVANDLHIQDCVIKNCDNVGLIKGYNDQVMLDDIIFDNNTNGITFQNINELSEINCFWNLNNHNTYTKYIGAFTHIIRTGGDCHSYSANSAVGIDITGVTTITKGVVKDIVFLGNGTYVNGPFTNNWEVESHGLMTEKDEVATGNVYVTVSATTVIATVNTPYKIAGTTSTANIFRVSAPVNNRLTYTGTKTRMFQAICSLTSTFTGAGSNKFFTFYIAKNGVILPESKQKVKLASNTDQGPLSLSCNVQLAPNDYVEVWVENNTDATDMIIYSMNLSIK